MTFPRRLAGVIGYPARHSLSPVFQQAALDHLGIPVSYERWETPPEQLDSRFASLRRPEVLGANVTVPYKGQALAAVDEVADEASLIGAVNTIVNRNGLLSGHNTDAAGFLRAVREEGGLDPKGKRVWALGAGGAAKAVVVALAQAGASHIVIVNRTLRRAEALTASLRESRLLKGQAAEVRPWGTAPVNVDIIVNATSMGMRHSDAESETPLRDHDIPSNLLVVDLVYRAEGTPLLREAEKAGARTLDGLPMLIYQGAMSFELWTGREAPIDVMFDAARRAFSR